MIKTEWRQFRALNTDIILLAEIDDSQAELFDLAITQINSFEKNFSRFVGNSELTLFNKQADGKLAVSRQMADLIKISQHYFKITGGIFDPTIIGELEAVGYNDTFEKISGSDDIHLVDQGKGIMARPNILSDVKVCGGDAEKYNGIRLDFGGIGKGYIVDYLAGNVFAPLKSYWLSAGGDLFLKGTDKDGLGWHVDIEHPLDVHRDILQIKTYGKSMGVATSGINRRYGTGKAGTWHHIIDPRTGLPVQNEIIAVTAIAKNAKDADVFAKTVLILGVKLGLEFIERQDGCAVIIFTKQVEPIFSNLAQKYL